MERMSFSPSLKVCLAVIVLLNLQIITAQNNTLYLMHSLPQANQLNPALKHPCKIYISLPVISSVRFNERNTGFGFHDVFYTGAGSTDNYFLDLEKLGKSLRQINYVLSNTDIDLLGVGFPYRDWYITFGISSHASFQGTYPHDIIALQDHLWDVNAGTAVPVQINNLEIDATAWNSIGFSASKEIRKGFRIGARIKYLNGMANVTTRESSLSLNPTASPPSVEADLNYKIYSSLPMSLTFAGGGQLGGIDFAPALHNLAGNYLFTGNHGLSTDGGLVYDVDEATQISASFTDLGFIRWKKNITHFSVDEKIIFPGAELDQFINNPQQGNFARAIRDTLRNSINASKNAGGYFTALPLNLYGGITRQLLPDLKAGATTWIEINSGHIRPSLTLSLNFTPFNAFAATVSYTLMNNKFNQIGTGFVFGNHGAQFYLITDNIVLRFNKDPGTALIWPYNARMLSLRFGMNLFFGCSKKGYGPNPHKSYRSKSIDDCPAYN